KNKGGVGLRKSRVIEILARRLQIAPGRVSAIADRLASAGLVTITAGSRRYPPVLAEPEILAIFIAVIADNGLGKVRETVDTFSALVDNKGQRLDIFLGTLFFGPPRAVQHFIARQSPPGVSIIVDGNHQIFGAEPAENAATSARLIPGAAIAAIAAELQGASLQQADAAAAIARIHNGY